MLFTMRKLVYLLLLIFSLLCAALLGASPQTDNFGVDSWIDSLSSSGVVLSKDEFDELHSTPFCVVARKESPARNYLKTLEAVKRKKQELIFKYRSARSSKEKDEIVTESISYINAIVYRVLFPLWVGIGWDFNGVPGRVPSVRRPVACGHIVEKMLSDCGFRIGRNRGYRLAYLAPREFVRSVKGYEPDHFRVWNNLKRYFTEMGRGLYIIGIWGGHVGHILMGYYDSSGRLWLLHSGIHPKGASVNIDDGEYYLRDFMYWDDLWITKIDTGLARKWLENEQIVPVIKPDR